MYVYIYIATNQKGILEAYIPTAKCSVHVDRGSPKSTSGSSSSSSAKSLGPTLWTWDMWDFGWEPPGAREDVGKYVTMLTPIL